MSFFNSNITGASGSGGAAGGLVTKFEKTVNIGASELAEVVINLADDISNYADITNEQIIVELANIWSNHQLGVHEAKLAHSYNSETGDLTLTSTSSYMPFRGDSGSTINLIIYVAGTVQIPPVRKHVLSVNKYGQSGSGSAQSGSGSTTTFNFVVDVGQVAILSAGTANTTDAIPFASGESANTQGWDISDKRAVLGSNRGGCNTTDSNTNNGNLGCLIVMPTSETGAVSCSTTAGATSWVGMSYIILDINEV